MPLPDFCIRGVPKIKDITPEGKVYCSVFIPDTRTAETRLDHCSELSINWEVDGNAITFSLNQFPNGVVKLERTKIDMVNTFPGAANDITYEHTPNLNPPNPYHGNILFHNHVSPNKQNMIASFLALASSSVIT